MGDGDSGSACGCVEEGIAHVAMAQLPPRETGNVERVSTIGADQTEIDGWSRLQFDFQQLIANVWESAVVRIG